MKSYSIQQKPCQVIAEGCSYQLQRYKNNLKKQMILQENRKIDRNRLHPAQNNWHKSHSRFYSSLFTFSLETPINKGERGVKSGSEPFTTLHPSSPYYIIDREFLRIYLSMRDTIRPYFTMIFLPFTM